MKNNVKLYRLDQYLKNDPEYLAAMEHVRKTAASLGVSEEALRQILEAYQEAEQIRADYLCEIGFPLKEKHHAYGAS